MEYESRKASLGVLKPCKIYLLTSNFHWKLRIAPFETFRFRRTPWSHFVGKL